MTPRVQSALAAIDPTLRETWVKVGMALQAEFGEAALPVWDAWSRQASNYSPGIIRSQWRSFRAGGGVTLGTLFALARKAGWKPNGEPHEVDQEERKRLWAEARKAERERRKREKRVAARVSRIRHILREVPPSHPYAARKGVEIPVRALYRGREIPEWRLEPGDILLPLRDAHGWQSAQVIKPDGDKRFLPGGVTRGCYAIIGEADRPGRPEALCEGLATGASIYATRRFGRVFCAMSAHNLKVVGQRAKRAGVTLLVVADNDESGTGERYARESGQPWWMPHDRGDANDHHQRQGIKSLAAQLREACNEKL